MAKRMSNRERVQRAAAEAAARDREKTEKTGGKSTSSSTPRKRATKKAPVRQRQMTVWKVFDNSFKEVAVFAYPEKKKAETEAARLTKETGKTHFVNDVVVPMED